MWGNYIQPCLNISLLFIASSLLLKFPVVSHYFGGTCLLLPTQNHPCTKGNKCQGLTRKKKKPLPSRVHGAINRDNISDSMLLREDQGERLKGEDTLSHWFSLSFGDLEPDAKRSELQPQLWSCLSLIL